MGFYINNVWWEIEYVSSDNCVLMRSDGSITVGCTDGKRRIVYLSNALKGAYLERVLAHEICHCIMFSYDIHIPIEQEEFLANWFSLYGREGINILDGILQTIQKEYAI